VRVAYRSRASFQAQRYTGNADESNRAAKIFDDKAEECCAERCTDARERPNKALCQVESARAFGKISHNQCREHAQHTAADTVEQLNANE